MKIQKTIIALVLILSFTACKKEHACESDDSVNNIFKGTVNMYDEGVQGIDKSGVNVVMESSGTEITSATTDTKGEFFIPVSKTIKEFTLILSKPGMGTYKEYFKMIGNDQLQKYYVDKYIDVDWNQFYQLGLKSTVTVNNLTAEIRNSQLIINFNVASTASEGNKSVRFLFQKDLPDISINTVKQDVYSIGNLYNVITGQNTLTSCLPCFTDCRDYKSGDKIYLTAYGESTYTNGYTDLGIGKQIFPNLNVIPNNTVISVVIP